MKIMLKKVLLVVLAIMPIASVSFAAQSALSVSTVNGVSSGDATPPSVSWTNGK